MVKKMSSYIPICQGMTHRDRQGHPRKKRNFCFPAAPLWHWMSSKASSLHDTKTSAALQRQQADSYDKTLIYSLLALTSPYRGFHISQGWAMYGFLSCLVFFLCPNSFHAKTELCRWDRGALLSLIIVFETQIANICSSTAAISSW